MPRFDAPRLGLDAMMNGHTDRIFSPGRAADAGDSAELGKVKGRINSYLTYGTVDGPGVRFVLFLQGCPLRCLYCHNPDAVSGEAKEVWTAKNALTTILRYRSFIRNGGVTFSGGEPLVQVDFVHALAVLLRRAGLHTAIDTSGCLEPLSVRRALDAADMLLLDIKAGDPAVAAKLTGQDNVNAFATLNYCEETGKPVWIRHVLLRGYTLDAEALSSLVARLKRYRCVERVELLPFHKYGEDKGKRLGREYVLADVAPTTARETEWAKAFFVDAGLRVQ